ncbi:MAG TPA: hypothetical protein VJ508_19650, partial [Saprospiraceae bacterium]|nr:hypothetical protein [Saprospiraceae bacterium]
VEARSNNVLNTVSVAAGYAFNRDSKAKGPYLTAIFGMWYPQFFVGISRILQEEENINGTNYKALNNRFTAGVSLPLLFTPGLFSQTLTPAVSYNNGVTIKRLPEGYEHIHFNYGNVQVLFVNSRKTAYRQPVPTWGQHLAVSYSHELNGVRLSQFYADGDFAFPALRPSHNLVLQGEVLIQDISDEAIQLPDKFFGSRGFPSNDGQTQYHVGITYGFPVWYPDFGFGNILYTRRVRLQGFFDVAYSNDHVLPDKSLKSVGAELIFDIHFPPVSFGIRFAHLLSGYTGSQNQFEFFIPLQRF